MKPNIPKHPCANKCTEFKDEQCKTCLVREIEKREFELVVAPDEAYVKTLIQEFLPGDVVVYMNHIEIDNLEIVEGYQPNDHYWLESGQCVYKTWIRPATKAEIHANRRLSEAEQALAEVS
ncbi:hypothetical protein ACNPQK_11520 [Acinetobacter guillouiae]|uniref:hypothetical protein n=1 Tax=Acinetobacter guillouiae TaxID=106649 RepID=UPI003AF55EB1